MRRAFGILILACALPGAVSAQTIPDQIDAILARPEISGNNWTILVENRDGSLAYYQRDPTTGLAPASNTKMFTTAAAFGLLGTNYAFQTRIYRDGMFSGGVLSGDLNLVSEHDITWNTSTFSGNARRPLDTIAAALKGLGLTAVTGDVQCYGVCIYNKSSTANTKDTANHATYNAEAAVAFKAALEAQGISVGGVTRGLTGFNPPGTLLHTHSSTSLSYGGRPLRLDVACTPLMKVSHNPMADALLRHIGWKLSGTDSFTTGRNRVLPWLRNVAGLNTNGIVLNDGSGLSSANRFNARQCVDLTRYMIAAFPSWNTTLPIGCVDGTIGSRFCGTDGAG
jgi:D-alanyl-D-alanine carboxypeptidase